MNKRRLLKEIRACLAEAYGDRLRGVVLYGSQARGDAGPKSDIDILVLLDGPVTSWKDIKTCSDAIYPLMLEIGCTIDAMPVNIHDYKKVNAPLYLDAQREGITV